MDEPDDYELMHLVYESMEDFELTEPATYGRGPSARVESEVVTNGSGIELIRYLLKNSKSCKGWKLVKRKKKPKVRKSQENENAKSESEILDEIYREGEKESERTIANQVCAHEIPHSTTGVGVCTEASDSEGESDGCEYKGCERECEAFDPVPPSQEKELKPITPEGFAGEIQRTFVGTVTINGKTKRVLPSQRKKPIGHDVHDTLPPVITETEWRVISKVREMQDDRVTDFPRCHGCSFEHRDPNTSACVGCRRGENNYTPKVPPSHDKKQVNK